MGAKNKKSANILSLNEDEVDYEKEIDDSHTANNFDKTEPFDILFDPNSKSDILKGDKIKNKIEEIH